MSVLEVARIVLRKAIERLQELLFLLQTLWINLELLPFVQLRILHPLEDSICSSPEVMTEVFQCVQFQQVMTLWWILDLMQQFFHFS